MAAFELRPQTTSQSSSVLQVSELSAKMQFKTLARPSQIHLQNPSLRRFSPPPFFFNQCLKAHSHTSLSLQSLRISSVMNRGSRFAIGCIGSSEVVGDGVEFVAGNEENVGSVSLLEEDEVEVEVVGVGKQEFGVNQSIWEQMKEIMMFTGPATGLWICGPLMSLIDTAVIGQGSSVELAALGNFNLEVF